MHVVVEHAAGLDMLMVRGSDGGEWGPVLGTAVTTRVTNPDVAGDGDGNPWNAKKAAAMDDPAVRKAAADALMVQAGLDQPPEIEFMQLLPPRVGSSSDGRASYVALGREAQVSTGGLRGDGSRSARKRVPLDAALKGQTGDAKIDADKKKAVARSQDTMGSTSRTVTRDAAALRTFLEPWTSTVGRTRRRRARIRALPPHAPRATRRRLRACIKSGNRHRSDANNFKISLNVMQPCSTQNIVHPCPP